MDWIKVYDQRIMHDKDFVHRIKVNGKTLCLIKHEDHFFATQIKCPHAGADLSHGWCKSGKLICPYHRHEFDLKSGEGAEGQGDYIHTYPLEERDDGIYIRLKQRSRLLKWLFG